MQIDYRVYGENAIIKIGSLERKRKALSNAVRVHGELTKCAMIGQGVDRHLFALCVASGGLNLESDFLNKYKSAKWENVNGWELSTRLLSI